MPEMTPLEARLTDENEALRRENARQAQEIRLLREKIELLVRRVFGASSEKLDTGQLLLALEGEEAKKPETSGDAVVALEAETTIPAKPSRQRKAKGGITEAFLDSLPCVGACNSLADITRPLPPLERGFRGPSRVAR